MLTLQKIVDRAADDIGQGRWTIAVCIDPASFLGLLFQEQYFPIQEAAMKHQFLFQDHWGYVGRAEQSVVRIVDFEGDGATGQPIQLHCFTHVKSFNGRPSGRVGDFQVGSKGEVKIAGLQYNVKQLPEEPVLHATANRTSSPG